MPSFDIVSKVDPQMLDNAVNVTKKEITNRFDFKDTVVNIDLNKKDFKISLETADDMKMRQLIEVLVNRSNKQGIPPSHLTNQKLPIKVEKPSNRKFKLKTDSSRRMPKRSIR